jgi:tetratricopeptide (TPR) repeat protein
VLAEVFNRRTTSIILEWILEEGEASVHRTRSSQSILVLAAISVWLVGLPAQAQDPQTDSSSKPAEPASTPPKKASGKEKSDPKTQSAPDQPTWDPLRAEKDLEVGRYYMKKGDWDAAIDRFEDAATAKPGYALPFRCLGEAQEKKGLKREAIKSFTRYLDLYPHAEDADKIHKKIDKLWSEAEKDKKPGR